jgi:uncharacterized RDD family membrane protein YckC
LTIVPLLVGLLPVLFDDRRRGVHDMLAGTVVISDDEASLVERVAVPDAAPPAETASGSRSSAAADA